jgi:hypothetical protein
MNPTYASACPSSSLVDIRSELKKNNNNKWDCGALFSQTVDGLRLRLRVLGTNAPIPKPQQVRFEYYCVCGFNRTTIMLL